MKRRLSALLYEHLTKEEMLLVYYDVESVDEAWNKLKDDLRLLATGYRKDIAEARSEKRKIKVDILFSEETQQKKPLSEQSVVGPIPDPFYRLFDAIDRKFSQR